MLLQVLVQVNVCIWVRWKTLVLGIVMQDPRRLLVILIVLQHLPQ